MDAEDFGEILGNLLENAFRHSRETISVTGTTLDSRHVRIVVEDDGSGIADALIDEAMLPGRRLDEAGQGYGLGLNITRELAELYNGTLALSHSRKLGGLSCTITLPQCAKR